MNCPACGHKITKPAPKKAVIEFAADSREMRAARFFFAEIKKDVPQHREPNWQAWAKSFDEMFRIDEYEPKQVKDVILFARADEFWSANILSPAKLREKFVTLLAKMASGKKKFFTKYDPDRQQASQPLPRKDE